MIAVHCGAGHYSPKLYKDYNKLNKKSCKKAMGILENGGTAIEAVQAAMIVLEDDPLTNAGFGSNLTLQGHVEGDASLMNGKNLLYGGCGAVKKVKNPICLAYNVYEKQLTSLPLGLVPPNLIVGPGALRHAKAVGLKVVKNEKLISLKAMKQYNKYKKKLDESLYIQNELEGVQMLDTVGAVCIDYIGHVAAGCSSGGLLLKRPGRIGQAAQYGCGVWADSFDRNSRPLLAVCTTGCGEHLVQTHLAKTIAEDLVNERVCPTVDLHRCINEKFMNSRFLTNVEKKMGGALVIRGDNDSGEVSLMWGHSTECMGVGYMKKGDKSPKALISILPGNAREGESVNVGGTGFCLNFAENPG